MDPQLYELLHSCTVRIVTPKASGTGFFVVLGKILTCAHVIQPALESNVPVEIFWNKQRVIAQIQKSSDEPFPDLALLQVDLPNHPCVLLHEKIEPFKDLYSYGYAGDDSEGAPTTFSCEGWVGERREQLKFKLGRARPGMSGSPLLSPTSGCVCGMMQATFDRNIDLGGKALLSNAIFREFPELKDQQQQFHQQDRRWWNLLTHQQRQTTGLELPIPEGVGTPVEGQPTKAIKVVLSYSPDDKGLVDKLLKHLSSLRRQGFIESWHNQQIEGGSQPKEETAKRFQEADVILCLVSSSFIDSNQCYEVEMKYALERRESGKAVVIPVLLKQANWENTPLHHFQPIPRDKKPIASRANKDKALAEVAQEIERVVNNLIAKKT